MAPINITAELPGSAAELPACGCYYCLIPNTYRLPEPDLARCEKLVICLATSGPEISEKIACRFDRKEYLEGCRLDHLSNERLFDASEAMNREVAAKVREQGFNLTMPFFPGDGAIDLAWQSVFLAALKTQEDIPVTINDHDMLCPEKSILYVFGADRQVEPCDIRHDCRRCPRETCYFRKAKQEAKAAAP